MMRTTLVVIKVLIVVPFSVFCSTKTHVIVHLYQQNSTVLDCVLDIVRKLLKAIGSSLPKAREPETFNQFHAKLSKRIDFASSFSKHQIVD